MLTNKHSAEAHLLIEARLEHEGVPEVYGGGLARVLAVVCHCWHQQINTAHWLHRFSVGWLWLRLNDLLLHWSCRIQRSGWLWFPNAGKGWKKISKMEHWNNVTMVKQLFQDTLTHAPGPPHKQVTSTQKSTPTRNLHTHHISKHKPFMHTHTLTHTLIKTHFKSKQRPHNGVSLIRDQHRRRDRNNQTGKRTANRQPHSEIRTTGAGKTKPCLHFGVILDRTLTPPWCNRRGCSCVRKQLSIHVCISTRTLAYHPSPMSHPVTSQPRTLELTNCVVLCANCLAWFRVWEDLQHAINLAVGQLSW